MVILLWSIHEQLPDMMYSPVIPESAGTGRPLESHLNVDVPLVNVIEVSQDEITLGLVQADDSAGHRPVHPECPPTGRWVDANQWVSALNVLRSGIRILAVQIWVGGSVHSLLTIDVLAEVGRQLLVSRVSARPKCVATNGWDGVIVQVSYTRWLTFVHKIGVPSRRAPRFAEAGFDLGCLQSRPDHANTGHTWHLRDLRLPLI